MRTKIKDSIFYVYEHWRSDKNECFWVGKGYNGRAFDFSRNNHYDNIVRKLRNLNLDVEVRIIFNQLPELDALKIEIERIAHWRSLGIKLANITNGGEGTSGLKHSDEARAIMREKRAKQVMKPVSLEVRTKISKKQKGVSRGKNEAHSIRMTGRKLTKEHRQSISLGLIGTIFTEERRSKISNAHSGRIHTEQSRLNMSLSHLGKKHPESTIQKMRGFRWITDGISQTRLRGGELIPFGWKFGRLPPSEESIAKMSVTKKAQFAAKRAGLSL